VIAATTALAQFIVSARPQDVPAAMRHEARRALLNWLGCAIGGAHTPAVDLALDAMREFSGPPSATVINRGVRLDVPNTALVNGIGSSTLDFDDTHLRTVIHPTVPVASAALALAEQRSASGAELMHAFILGVEAECKVGNAISPEHYDAGWHVTSTCGVIGAAAACSRLLGLDARQTAFAIGMAASQASGLSDILGSMTRMVNMGHAARNGFLAAWYAARGFTSSDRALEAPRGFANAFTTHADWSRLVDHLGAPWELAANAYKPYPCGIVVHPVLDGCLQLRAAHGLRAETIDRVELLVNPLVIRIMGNPAPADGLRSKVSAEHCTAVALMTGAAGVEAFTDAMVHDPAVAALRARVVLQACTGVSADAATVVVVLQDGTRHETHVAHARGSTELPLSDRDLEDKFRALLRWGRSGADADALIATIWRLDELADVGVLARAG